METKYAVPITAFLMIVAVHLISCTSDHPDSLEISTEIKQFHQKMIRKLAGSSENEATVFMLSLYHQKRRKVERSDRVAIRKQKANKKKINRRERAALRQSNTVRSFGLTGFIKKDDTWSLTFDLSKFPTNERIRYAEVQIASSDFMNGNGIIVRAANTKNLVDDLGTIYFQKDLKTTKYDVTVFTRKWNKKQKSRNTAKFAKAEGVPTEGAILVIFSQHPKNDEQLLDVTQERQGRFRRDSYYQSKPSRQRAQLKSRKNNKDQSSHCRKVPFEVDFGKIGWNEWIIYPKRYQAYRCEGTCSAAMIQDHKPTNHAFVQSVYSSSRPDLGIGEPCCVPTKLKPLSLLYFENGEVVQRDHQDMVVEECGCR